MTRNVNTQPGLPGHLVKHHKPVVGMTQLAGELFIMLRAIPDRVSHLAFVEWSPRAAGLFFGRGKRKSSWCRHPHPARNGLFIFRQFRPVDRNGLSFTAACSYGGRRYNPAQVVRLLRPSRGIAPAFGPLISDLPPSRDRFQGVCAFRLREIPSPAPERFTGYAPSLFVSGSPHFSRITFFCHPPASPQSSQTSV
jgi:hypothetical protein